MNTVTRTYGYDSIRVRVVCEDDTHLRWLDEFLMPAFKPEAGAVDWTVRLAIDPSRFERWKAAGPTGAEPIAFILDSGERRLPAWRDPMGATRLYDDEMRVFYRIDGQEVLVLADHWKPRMRSALMRPIRELAMDAAQHRGGLLLHSAACAIDGCAILIAGPKEAGKTSLLTYALGGEGVDYLTNDRLLLQCDDAGLRAIGLPTVVSIRSETLKLFPEHWHRVQQARWKLHATLVECSTLGASPTRTWADGRLGLTPAQYASACRCRLVTSATPAMLLFPQRTGHSGGLSLTPISVAVCAAELAQCHFGASVGAQTTSFRRSDVFRVCGAEEESMRINVVQALTHLPAYFCRLGTDAFADKRGLEHLRRVLTNLGPPVVGNRL